MDEWIVYNLYGVGFDVIEIYDNSPDHKLKNMFGEHRGRVHVTHFPGKQQQHLAYEHMRQRVLHGPDPKSTWVAYFDCDEFLVLKKHTTVQELVAEYAVAPGILISWYVFGDSKRLTYTPEPVTERFLLRDKNTFHFGKSIVRPALMKTIKIHSAVCLAEGEHIVDTNWDPDLSLEGLHPNGPADVAVLHHYYGKTREEYTKKRARGRATSDAIRTMEEFDNHNMNDVFDDSAKHVYRAALTKYAAHRRPDDHRALCIAVVVLTCIILACLAVGMGLLW